MFAKSLVFIVHLKRRTWFLLLCLQSSQSLVYSNYIWNMKSKWCYQKLAPCSLQFITFAIFGRLQRVTNAKIYIFFRASHHTTHYHIHTSNANEFAIYIYFMIFIFCHFCCLLSTYQNLLRSISSLWKINQNVERRNKKKNVQETNFFFNIIIMMMSRRRRRFDRGVLSVSMQSKFAFLSVSCSYYLCIYTAWLRLKYS